MITSIKQVLVLLNDPDFRASVRTLVNLPEFQRMVEIVDFRGRPIQPNADPMTNALANAKCAGVREALEMMLTMHEQNAVEDLEATYGSEVKTSEGNDHGN